MLVLFIAARFLALPGDDAASRSMQKGAATATKLLLTHSADDFLVEFLTH